MRPLVIIGFLLFLALLWFSFTDAHGQTPKDLTVVDQVTLVPTEWADGDSFRVRFPDGTEHTVRLYGADCIEWHVTDESDARRLRAQRRYFGIAGYENSAQKSIDLAKSLGESAALKVRELLSKPFCVATAFADGRGDARFSRIYAFVITSEGKDLATELISHGLARAFGVYRTTPDGLSRGDYESTLKDAELVAAKNGLGAWKFTDWQQLTAERMDQREEEIELKIATNNQPPASPLDLNDASREALMQIPGIGEVTANAIIENRPFQSLDHLLRVPGIGEATLEKVRPYLRISGDREM